MEMIAVKEFLEKLEELEKKKNKLQKEKENLEKEADKLEGIVGIGTSRFIEASDSDLRDLENTCDMIELYDEQIKVIDEEICKLKEKFSKKIKR